MELYLCACVVCVGFAQWCRDGTTIIASFDSPLPSIFAKEPHGDVADGSDEPCPQSDFYQNMSLQFKRTPKQKLTFPTSLLSYFSVNISI